MTRLLLVGSASSRPLLLRRLASRHRVTVLGREPPAERGLGEAITVPDMRPETLLRALAGQRRRFRGVVCWDQMATFAANRVAAALGLPPLWEPTDVNLADKRALYQRWAEHGVPFPRTTTVGPDGPFPDGPCVVKPAALMGAIGARLCRTPNEAAAVVARLAQACEGKGPDGWIARLLQEHGFPGTILAQEVVTPDPTPDGEALEYTAEVAVAGGRPRLLAVFAKSHVGPPYFAETWFLLPPPPGAPVWKVDVEGLATAAARAAGMANGIAHLEFCITGGKVVFFELNPRLIGEPAPALMEEVHGIPVPDLLADLAQGNGQGAWARLDALPAPRPGQAAFISVRAGSDLSGRVYRGLDFGGIPLHAIEVDQVLANGKTIRVSELRGPARVADVRLRRSPPDQCARWLRHWQEADRIRVSEADQPPSPSPGGGRRPAGGLTVRLVEGAEPLLTPAGRRLAAAAGLTSSPAWVRVSLAMPETRRLITVTVEDGQGLLALLPCWVCDPVPSTHDPAQAAGIAAGATPAPVLLAGSRAGYTSQLLLRPGLAPEARRAAAAAAADGARAAADRAGLSEAWLMYGDAPAVRDLTGAAAGPALHLPPETAIPLGARSHEAWVASLPRRRRQELTKEARCWDGSGARVEAVPLMSVADEAGPLLAALNRRFGGTVSDSAMRRYLRLHAEAFGEAAVAFTCRVRGRLQAFSAAIEWRDELAVRVYGEERGGGRSDGLYFYLTVHTPVRFAALRALRAVSLGPGTYQAKHLHGAEPQARWAVPLATGHQLGPAALAANRAHVERELEGVPWPLPGAP